MKQELLHYMRKWDLDDDLYNKKAAHNQAIFVRDDICLGLLKVHGYVINTHYSKSCNLPVYFITLRNGIKLIMRNNFYDWKVSIETPMNKETLPPYFIPEDCLSYRMVENKLDKIPECYLEGFKDEWCYDAYNPEKPARKFTIEVPSKYLLFIIIHKLKHAYPNIVVNVEDDKRTKEELTRDINIILENNGHSEYIPNRFNEEKMCPLMYIYEILWRTYYKIDDKSEIDFPVIDETVDDYVDVIMKYPEIHEEFLREEMMYNSEPPYEDV